MGREKGAVVAGDGVAVDCRRGSSGSRGRTRGRVVVPWGRTVVPFHSRSYFGALLTYGRAGSGTTARRNVRPRASGYDRAGLPTTARPIRAGPARGARSDAGPMPAGGRSSLPGSSTPTAASADARRRAVLTGVPRRPVELDIPGRVGRRRRRTRAGMPDSWPRQPGAAPSDRSRCGTGPISARGTGRATPAGPGITSDRDVSSQFPVGWDARPRRGRPPARRRAPARIIPIDEGALHAGSCREGL